MDTEEHSRRFIKKLFSKGLIAEAEMEDGGFSRHFMKLGQTESESDEVSIQMTTTNSRLSQLINFINTNDPD
jgi:uncharacterized protein involved in tolerance to divalent cations